jgi:C4-dicarboxylate transporter DctQ subunit
LEITLAVFTVSIGSINSEVKLVIIGIAAIVIFEVVMRYIFNSPTTWSLEITEYLLVMGTFLGSAYVLKEKRHVVIDLLTSQLVGRTRAMVEIVNIVALLFFSGILLWYGQEVLVTVIAQGRVSPSLLHLPLWIPKSTVPVGAVLLVLHELKMLYQRVTSLRRGEAGDGVSIRCISLQNPAILLPLSLGLLGFETWLLLVNPILAMTLLILTTMFGGIPVAFSLGVTGCIMLMVLLSGEGGLLQAPMVAYKSLESFVLAAIPLFGFAITMVAFTATDIIINPSVSEFSFILSIIVGFVLLLAAVLLEWKG